VKELKNKIIDFVKVIKERNIKELEMAPTSIGLNNNTSNGQSAGDSPLSKTYQYRKIMKPMLERKRRARINRCLDELKDLITGALQNVS
jgi:hypothetical protein